MISLSKQHSSLSISNQGVIDKFCINNTYNFESVPIYSFVFEEHSFSNTMCRHLDDVDTINLTSQCTDKVIFNKTFENISSQQIITLYDDKIQFNFNVLNVPPGYCFGYVIPIPSMLLYSVNKELKYNIINYCKTAWRPRREQQQISMPVVSSKIDSHDVSILSPMDYNIQFFKHTQHSQPCLRVAAFTTHTNCLDVTLIVHKEELNDIYQKCYPIHINNTPTEDNEDFVILDHTVDRVLDNLRPILNIDLSAEVDVTSILDLCRSARHPSISWSVDFIKPKPEMQEIKYIINHIDEHIFVESNSVNLKNNIIAEINQVAAFHNIRAHIRAEEGNIIDAIKIYADFYTKHYEDLDLSRKANLHYAYALALLSDAQYDKAWHQYEKLWILLKSHPMDDLLKNGIIDAWSLLNNVFWYFMKYVTEFRDFISKTLNIHSADIWNHKKIYHLNILQNDHTWLVSLMGIGFYRHACKKMTDLPSFIV